MYDHVIARRSNETEIGVINRTNIFWFDLLGIARVEVVIIEPDTLIINRTRKL